MDFDQYRLQENEPKQPPFGRERVRHAPFIKGPIPWRWIQNAMVLRGSALAVGIALWYFAGLKKSRIFKIGMRELTQKIQRSWLTTQRGLLALERAKLISIDRRSGSKNIIGIKDEE